MRGAVKSASIIFVITLILFLVLDYIYSSMPHTVPIAGIPHAVYHHDLKPDTDIVTTFGPLTHRLCTDSNGFKAPCEDESPSDGQGQRKNSKHFDVAFLGDSFTEGVGYAYEKTFVGLFAKAHPELRVANLAVSSFSPIIYYKKLEYLLENGYTFGHLVVFPDISDIQDEAVYYVMQDGAVVHGPEQPAASKSDVISYKATQKRFNDLVLAQYGFVARQYFALRMALRWNFRLTFGVLDKIFPPKAIPDRAHVSENDWPVPFVERSTWTFDKNSPEYGTLGVQGGVDKALHYMQQLKTLTDAHQIKLSVGVYPWPAQLTYDKKEHWGVSLWRDFCKEVACESFIDANSFFYDAKDKDGLAAVIDTYYIPRDVHFNAEGNKAVHKAIEKQWFQK